MQIHREAKPIENTIKFPCSSLHRCFHRRSYFSRRLNWFVFWDGMLTHLLFHLFWRQLSLGVCVNCGHERKQTLLQNSDEIVEQIVIKSKVRVSPLRRFYMNASSKQNEINTYSFQSARIDSRWLIRWNDHAIVMVWRWLNHFGTWQTRTKADGAHYTREPTPDTILSQMRDSNWQTPQQQFVVRFLSSIVCLVCYCLWCVYGIDWRIWRNEFQ